MKAKGEFLRRLVRVLADPRSLDSMPGRLCDTVVDTSGADGGAIALRTGPGSASPRAVLCASSDDAQRFEDAQDVARQGPAYDVLAHGRPVTVADLRAQRLRWPVLLDVLGDDALLRWVWNVVPMQHGHDVVGALTLHRPAGATLAVDDADLQFLADTVAAAVISQAAGPAAARIDWGDRDLIAQATGMLVAQLDLSPQDAEAVLRARAYAEQSTTVAIARSVVQRRIHFRPGGEESPW